METFVMLTRAEKRLAETLWANESIGSADLVRITEYEFGWKKSFTLNHLKSLIEKGIAENEDSRVSMLYTREELVAEQSCRYVEEAFGGSLPMFFVSYTSKTKLPPDQIDLMKRLILKYEKDNMPKEEATKEEAPKEEKPPQEETPKEGGEQETTEEA